MGNHKLMDFLNLLNNQLSLSSLIREYILRIYNANIAINNTIIRIAIHNKQLQTHLGISILILL